VGARRRFLLKLTLATAVVAAVLFSFRTLWLTALGSALVYDQGPAKAGIAVVLAGDYSGCRILKGAEMVREGYVPLVLVSGPEGFYGFRECDLAVEFAERHGCPADWFAKLPVTALSTRDEALEVLAELSRRGVRNFLLVTSNYHSARATRIYRAAERRVGGPPFRTVAAPDPYFSPDSWWHNREGRKTFFFEWVKTVTGPLGI
jgi:uncharacterized SAM-binding protein YcdF (DUF218 family)